MAVAAVEVVLRQEPLESELWIDGVAQVEVRVVGMYRHRRIAEPEQAAEQPRPAQQIPSIKVSEVEMAAMREVLLQMPAGSKWEVALPPDKAYGADPRTGFPPNVAVVFEIKLVSVK